MPTQIITSEIFKDGNVAVITGASSGIGRAFSLMCSDRGMHVWMVDVDKEELELAVDMVKSHAKGTNQIEGAVVDVSDECGMKTFAAKVFSSFSTVHFLMNNAGIGLGGGALTTSMNEFQKVINVNVYGAIHGCVAFAPTMKEKGEHGLIVNTGSKQGITMPPGNLTYNISKAALKTYTEGLEHELMLERTNMNGKLRAALLIPGWVNTSIHLKEKRARAEEAGTEFDINQVFFHENKPAEGAWMPSQVVDFMLQELDKERFYIVCPDNDVDRHTDNLRMTWAMQDITENRSPLSRWHPDW
eukprot:CAMPEP_0197831614 /NCGR_PEP_ID=MMETSP1437-20131217/11332_1 /TAXON_ID=49252 ORGANISM="Eucampia antarctica, Strain CCMP1452" /NCGR_SAMPLE_ID=MMETSP1437 /ASSEMBLY_ACC=CAM_ASM_001096 /LENGTH=300 /DNA_ID=CAMNT_0043434613 /DNA_START=45 /DNA_END=944 /DNA_ORIENTATION=-